MDKGGRFSGQVVLVTGGGGGIGRATALAFAREGAAVVVSDLQADAAERVSADVRGTGAGSAAVAGDVSRPDDCDRMVRTAVEAFGQVDVLVNNAGIGGTVGPVRSMDLDDWNQTLAVNLTGAMLCSKAALAVMLLHKRGAIINVASNVGKRGLAMRSPYVVSKWAMLGLTQTLALELAREGIRVNAVCPGPVEGERVEGFIRRQAAALGVSEEQVRDQWLAEVPMRRMVTADEVANVILFLASEQASAMTGQAINVTGGLIMH